MKKQAKPTNDEKAAARVAAVITAGRVLVAYNPVDHEDTSVGPYREAVDGGIRFAVLGWRGQFREARFETALEAAAAFVRRVGSTRAREVAIRASGRLA